MPRPLAPSSRQLARRSSLCGLIAVSLALPACRGGAAGGSDDPALAAIQARMPPLPTVEVGPAPGFLAGGALYLAMRPGRLQRWLQTLPLGPDVVRDLATIGNELGFDPRIDDVAARLGLEPDALISATLFRPLGDPAAVRALLQRGVVLPPDPFPGLGATPSDIGPLPRDYDRMQPPPIQAPIQASPPPPQPVQAEPAPMRQPPPPPQPPQLGKPTPEQGDLARQAGALGTHARVHIPVKDLALALAPLRRFAARERPPELESLCAQLGPSELCVGSSSELVLVRSAGSAIAIDLFVFHSGTGAAFDAERVTAAKAALSAPIASLAPLSTLRGDLVAYADADALPAVHEAMSVAAAASALRWYPQGVKHHLDEAAALALLRETRRLFAGARLEVAVDGDTLQASFQWEPRDDDARQIVTRLFTRSPAAASVPTISGLCDGGLACLRTAGLPAVAAFDELAVGVYARTDPELSRVMRDAESFSGLVLFLETWPNLLGAAQRWPKQLGRSMEAVMFGQVLEASGRVEGIGGSLRDLHVGRDDTRAEFVGYMRLQAQDLALLRSLTGLAGVRSSPVTLPQVTGKVESARLPDSDVPASLYLVGDPGTVRAGERDIEVGWAAIADSDERLGWMLGRERSAVVAPAFYLELPDVWPLLAAIDDARDELNFARSWLTGRSARLAADVVDGRIRVDFQLARSAPATAAVAD